MKKSLLTLALSMALALSAQAQTVVNSTWNGAGVFNFAGTVSNGASLNFVSGGNLNAGAINFTNAQDNPYSYGVSTVSANVAANVANGGGISSAFSRDSSYVPMYGAAGQVASTHVDSTGSASVATYNTANYAGLSQVNYGNTMGPTVAATGDYNFTHRISGGANLAQISGGGSGSVAVKTNYSGASAGGVSFAQGGGIYTLASYTATGAGGVTAQGQGSNLVSGFGSSFAGPGAAMIFGGNFGAGATITYFSMKAN